MIGDYTMSTVNYTTKHKGVRLIDTNTAWVRTKNGNFRLNPNYHKTLVGGMCKKRRVVSMGNDRNNMAVKRIMSLYDKNGNKKERLIPIEKYPDIPKASGVEDKTFYKTTSGKPIQEKYLGKTNTRLNKWDMERIRRGKNKPKK